MFCHFIDNYTMAFSFYQQAPHIIIYVASFFEYIDFFLLVFSIPFILTVTIPNKSNAFYDVEGLMQPLCLIYQVIFMRPFSPFPYRHAFEGILHLLAHLQAACEGD